MAFELKVEKFCDGCGYFEADVMRFKKCENVRDVETAHIQKYTDTYISCKHLAHCKKMREDHAKNLVDNAHHMDADEMKGTLEKLCAKFGFDVDPIHAAMGNVEFYTEEDIDNG